MSHGNVLVLASVPSPRPAGYSVRTGAVFQMEDTSSGYVILAFSDEDTSERALSALDERNAKRARERMAGIRRRGYEDAPSTMVAGVRNLCVPVFSTNGIVGAITSGFIEQHGVDVSSNYAIQCLKTSAQDLSQALGHSPQRTKQEEDGPKT